MINVPTNSTSAPHSLQKALADEQAHLFHVVGGANHQLAGLVAVMIGKGELGDLGVQVIAHIEGNPLRVALGPVGLQEGEDPAHRSKGHDRDASGDQDLLSAGVELLQFLRGVAQLLEQHRQELWRHRAQVGHHVLGDHTAGDGVDDAPQQLGHRQLRQHRNDQKDVRQQRFGAIARQIPNGAPQRAAIRAAAPARGGLHLCLQSDGSFRQITVRSCGPGYKDQAAVPRWSMPAVQL
jgi:hypothetical protein